jgi:mitochondrial enoyl-[acyl-carrier protein] reductase / trans-2-enoyl-CoA reductase
MSKVRAIIYHLHGPPGEAAATEEIPIFDPEAGEVRVRVLLAPINPADLNAIEGKYPNSPPPPAVPGGEGVGIVEEVGPEVSRVRPGDLTLLPHGFGAWREAGIAKSEDLLRVPPGIPMEQAAMMRINTASALRMLRDFVELKPGDWVAQNAANSAVGRFVIQIACASGLRTVNIVRREELIAELEAQGADAVILEGPDMNARISAATGGAPIRLALNAVGGESAAGLANSLAPGSTIVTYGAMARKPLRIQNGLLIFQDLRWRGFWISQWYRNATPDERAAMFAELFELARRGILRAPVERIYPLTECAAALAHAARPGRSGKILFGAPEYVRG